MNKMEEYVSARPGPEGWARVRAGEGAGRAYLSSPIAPQHTFSDARWRPVRDGGDGEYGQRGGFGAVPAVPAAPRKGHGEGDAHGPEISPGADKEPSLSLEA